jgi:hypothetical protein
VAEALQTDPLAIDPEQSSYLRIHKTESLQVFGKTVLLTLKGVGHPAKVGIQFFQVVTTSLDSGFYRSDDFL